MTNRTNRPDPPSSRGPWPKATDGNRLYDHGAPWCVNSAGHPPREDGYPDPQIHQPPYECRSVSIYLDDLRADLDGPPLQLEIYLAQPFQFGQLRTTEPAPRPHLIFEYLDDVDEPVGRFSLPIADGFRLALEVLRLLTAISAMP